MTEEIGAAVEGATQGDYTHRIRLDGKEAFHADLCGKFNQLIDTVSGTVREVRSAAETLATLPPLVEGGFFRQFPPGECD